ncbi:MAG TPA: protoglobin domain-containing protein [Allosphingosinicella sp.]|nr:protoglobin domain-containing protein [Allosphingosinicella sp.]
MSALARKAVGNIAGYDYGEAAPSPLTLKELDELKATVDFTDEDRQALVRAGRILVPQAEAMVDEWRAVIGAHKHLGRWFLGLDGKPDDRYKSLVKARFVRWVVDLFERPFDQAWLDYQEEIGLRHTPAKKNDTDHARTPDHVPLRHLFAFCAPVSLSVGRRLKAAGTPPNEAERMQAAWTKAVILSVTLWSRPYAKDGLW